MIYKRQGLLLRIPFADNGRMSNYARTMLVIDVDYECNCIKLLNISSIKGTEHKLLMDSNKPFDPYQPPFNKRSFAKLDAVYIINNYDESVINVLSNGDKLDEISFNDIISAYENYREDNEDNVLVSTHNWTDLVAYN